MLDAESRVYLYRSAIAVRAAIGVEAGPALISQLVAHLHLLHFRELVHTRFGLFVAVFAPPAIAAFAPAAA